MKTINLITLLAAVILFSSSAAGQESTLRVDEARLGTDVQDRQIVGEDSSFAVESRVYLWMRIVGGAADSITIEWKHADQSFPVRLNVGGSPWRTWSYKTAYEAGDWTVTVMDDAGAVLKEMNFTVK